jgi:hypothetical protein
MRGRRAAPGGSPRCSIRLPQAGQRDLPERHEAVVDALARSGSFPSGWCGEVGSGTGNATADLRGAFTMSSRWSWQARCCDSPRRGAPDPRRCRCASAALRLGGGGGADQHVPVSGGSHRVLAQRWRGVVGEHERERDADLPPSHRGAARAARSLGRRHLPSRVGNVAHRTPDHGVSRRVAKGARRPPSARGDRSASL